MNRNKVDSSIFEVCRHVDLPCGLSKVFCQNALTKVDESCLSAKRAFHLVRTRGLNKFVFWTVVRGLVSIRVRNTGFAVFWTVVKDLVHVIMAFL